MSRRTLAALLVGCSLVAVSSAQAGPPRGYQQVISGVFDSPHQVERRGTVDCPAGSVPLGGGTFVSSLDTHVAIASSFPTPTGWDVDLDNESAGDTIFDVRATCARPPSRYTVVRSTPVVVPSGGQASAFAVCPKPTRALGGGGVWDTSGPELTLNSSYPGPFTWNVTGNNRRTISSQLTAIVICGRPKGFQTVFGFTSLIGPGQTPLTNSCFAPRVPLSGGVFADSTSTLVSLNASTFSNSDWITWVNNPTAGAVPAQPFVVCAGT